MPLPISDILRTREANAPLHGVEPPEGTDALVSEGEVPGVTAPPVAPPPPPAAPPVNGAGLMDQGAQMMLDANQAAIANQQQSREKLQAAIDNANARRAPLKEAYEAQNATPSPEVPDVPALPAPPSLRVRPFLESDGNDPYESIQNVVVGLSTLAQMGFGAASGVPELSLRAMQGALQGWQEGDMTRGDREFKNWQGTVKTIQDDYENRVRRTEQLMRKHYGDTEALRQALIIDAAEHGRDIADIQSLVNSDQAYFQLLDKQGQIIGNLGMQKEQLRLAHDKALEAERQHQEMMQKWLAEAQRNAARDAETARHNRVTEGIAQQNADTKAANAGPAGKNARQEEARAAGLAIVDQLDTASAALITAKPGLLSTGPQYARLQAGAMSGSNPQAKAYDALMRGSVVKVLRALGDSGALSNQDVARGESLIPTFSDSAESRTLKIKQLRELISGKTDIASGGSSGSSAGWGKATVVK